MSPLPPLDTRGLDPITRIRAAIIESRVKARNQRALKILQSKQNLWKAIQEYEKVSKVTGASMSDYLTLYQQIREHKPTEVLELGTGFSTVILAHALLENEAEGSPRGRITSMEEHEEWFKKANQVLPPDVAHLIQIIHSPKVDGFYKIFRGVQYRELPEKSYDFVFSDGPERHSRVNGDKLFDLDLVQIVRRSERPVRAIVDNHYLTFYILQKIFGSELARYSVAHRLMFVGPVTKHDVRRLRKENFVPDLRLLSTTELKLRMSV